MTHNKFAKQSNELFLEIQKTFAQKVSEAGKPAFKKANENPDKIAGLYQLLTELTFITSTNVIYLSLPSIKLRLFPL